MTGKSQSALEYMMTYGWAILIIVIVAAALYSMGIFSPSNSASSTVNGFSGLGNIQAVCEAGGLAISMGNSLGKIINITGISDMVGSSVYSLVFPNYTSYSAAYRISPDQRQDFLIINGCPNNTRSYSASVMINYTEPGQTFTGPYTSKGTISGKSTIQYPLYNSSLLVYWPFAEGSGTKAYSLGAYANTLTLNSDAYWASESVGTVLFNNINTNTLVYQSLTNTLPASSGTIAFWMQGTTPGTDFSISNGGNQQINIGINNGGIANITANIENTTSTMWRVSQSGIVDTNWHYVAVSWSVATSTFSLYVDGTLVENITADINSMVNWNNVKIWCGEGTGTGCNWNGGISQLRIYDDVLSASLIHTLYTSSAPDFE